MTVAELYTTRLRLQPSVPDDAADFIALERDPDVMRFLNGGAVDHAITDPAAVTFLMPRGTEPDVWTARKIDDGSFVGWFCLAINDDGHAEIGYRLRREVWENGLASEGALALLDWGFATAGLQRIEACTMTVNTGSRRVMEKIGLIYQRTVPFADAVFPGTEQGEVWYALDREDWARARRR